jgi:hypothetical protein
MRAKSLILVLVAVAVILGSSVWAKGDMIPAGAAKSDVAADAIAVNLNDFELKVEGVTAGPNIDGIAFIVLAVTYEGAGVDGLTIANFTLGTHIVGPCGSLLEIQRLVTIRDGKYRLDVVPIRDLPWMLGKYLLSVKVDVRPQFKASGMTVVTLDVTNIP